MDLARRKHVAVIGGGPAGLMAAEVIAAAGLAVTVYEGMPSAGRKLLLAGRGGLNITHGEDLDVFLGRYGAARPALSPAIAAFPPADVRTWCAGLGEETFVGSSGRVFPRAMKASPLLRAWLRRLASAGVIVATRHRWLGWDEAGRLRIAAPEGEIAIAADATILALGGASWPRLGSDGAWVQVLAAAGCPVTPLEPANCGFRVAWTEHLTSRFAGAPLKRIALRFGSEMARGEAMVTASGLEGGAVYALSRMLRQAIAADGVARITIDLRPDDDEAELARQLSRPRGKQSLASVLRKTASLPPVAVALMHEAALTEGLVPSRMTAEALAALIKAVPLTLLATEPIARAISTAGGVALAALDSRFMLTGRPGVFVAGEMLDWEAPTGGYLLQACLATGAAAGHGAVEWLAGDGAADGATGAM